MSDIAGSVAAKFSARCHSYDRLARVQNLTATDLAYVAQDYLPGLTAVHLEGVDARDFSILDVGAGTGLVYRRLFPDFRHYGDQLHLYAWDLSEDMLALLKEYLPQVHTCKMDFNHPAEMFYAGSYNLILSSFALQWSSDPAELILKLLSLLKSRGVLLVAVPVAGSLSELKEAFSSAQKFLSGEVFPGEKEFFNTFPSLEDMASHLYSCIFPQERGSGSSSFKSCCFSDLSQKITEDFQVLFQHSDSERELAIFGKSYCITYPGLSDALHSITKIGAGTSLQGGKITLNRKILTKAAECYPQKMRGDPGYPVTYQLAFIKIKSLI